MQRKVKKDDLDCFFSIVHMCPFFSTILWGMDIMAFYDPRAARQPGGFPYFPRGSADNEI